MHISSTIIATILALTHHLSALPLADSDASKSSSKGPPSSNEDGIHSWNPPLQPRLVCDWPFDFKRCAVWTNQGYDFAPGAFCSAGAGAEPGFRNPAGRDTAMCKQLCRCEIPGHTGLKEREMTG
ncbi:MAG: hypothetical protein Q9220_005954 [cf. Caloplaca sp. 1 TL-2023]